MQKIILAALAGSAITAIFALQTVSTRNSLNAIPPRQTLPDVADIASCGPSPISGHAEADSLGRFAPVFTGWGHYHFPVKTGNDSAQFFFDQGINLYYSYHLTEAVASFKESARRDSTCAMAYWGQALALGPYYNGYGYKMPPAVLPVLKKMNSLASLATSKEGELMEAMAKRYADDTTDSRRSELNAAYAAALRTLVRKFPTDNDIRALYIDAVMLQHVWDFWAADGSAKPWTPELVSYCSDILKSNPEHPAALHYQIHLTEASMHPEQALHSADVLQKVMPGVPHMVHMSSHMYQRNGLYSKGIVVNDRAALLQIAYDSAATNLKLGTSPLTHFEAVESYCAMNANMFGKALETANRLHDRLHHHYSTRLSSTFFQYIDMMPMFARVRSGKWQELLTQPLPDSTLVYASLLDAFGKGMASARNGDTLSAASYLHKMRMLITDSSLMIRNMPFNKAVKPASIALQILSGETLAAQGRLMPARTALEEAVKTEDSLIYREPKEWPIPARHYLGAVLLQQHNYKKAEEVYRDDLRHNPGNGWSQVGLCNALKGQRRFREAARWRRGYTLAFAGSQIPPGSVY